MLACGPGQANARQSWEGAASAGRMEGQSRRSHRGRWKRPGTAEGLGVCGTRTVVILSATPGKQSPLFCEQGPGWHLLLIFSLMLSSSQCALTPCYRRETEALRGFVHTKWPGPTAALRFQLCLPERLGRRLGRRPKKEPWRFLEFPLLGVGGGGGGLPCRQVPTMRMKMLPEMAWDPLPPLPLSSLPPPTFHIC